MESKEFALNVCILSGLVFHPPQWRELPSGASVTTFDLKVQPEVGRTDVIRVSWLDAAASALDLAEGTHVLVCGRVRTYWANRTVTDMSATSVVPVRSVMKVRRNLASAMAVLQQACP